MTGTIASLKNAIKPTCPNHDSHASHTGDQSHSPVKKANQKSGESIIYIHSLMARIKSTQQSAINMMAKNTVTINASPKSRTIPIRF